MDPLRQLLSGPSLVNQVLWLLWWLELWGPYCWQSAGKSSIRYFNVKFNLFVDRRIGLYFIRRQIEEPAIKVCSCISPWRRVTEVAKWFMKWPFIAMHALAFLSKTCWVLSGALLFLNTCVCAWPHKPANVPFLDTKLFKTEYNKLLGLRVVHMLQPRGLPRKCLCLTFMLSFVPVFVVDHAALQISSGCERSLGSFLC